MNILFFYLAFRTIVRQLHRYETVGGQFLLVHEEWTGLDKFRSNEIMSRKSDATTAFGSGTTGWFRFLRDKITGLYWQQAGGWGPREGAQHWPAMLNLIMHCLEQGVQHAEVILTVENLEYDTVLDLDLSMDNLPPEQFSPAARSSAIPTVVIEPREPESAQVSA